MPTTHITAAAHLLLAAHHAARAANAGHHRQEFHAYLASELEREAEHLTNHTRPAQNES